MTEETQKTTWQETYQAQATQFLINSIDYATEWSIIDTIIRKEGGNIIHVRIVKSNEVYDIQIKLGLNGATVSAYNPEDKTISIVQDFEYECRPEVVFDIVRNKIRFIIDYLVARRADDSVLHDFDFQTYSAGV